MGLTYSDLQIQKNTSAWTISGGVHVTALYPTLGIVTGHDQPPTPLYMLEGDNNVNTKIISRPMPADGQNPNVSIYWECWLRLNDIINDQPYFLIGNQQSLDINDASFRGYGIQINVGNSVIIIRADGGGVVLGLVGAAFIADTNLHRYRISRYLSGANRRFRLYIDDMTTPVAEHANDATYTNFQWWGWYHSSRPRIVCGGESCQS